MSDDSRILSALASAPASGEGKLARYWCAVSKSWMDANCEHSLCYEVRQAHRRLFATPIPAVPAVEGEALQQRVQPWMMACFGPEIAADKIERNHRFLEEALELVQACGCTQDEAHQLVDYTYGRPQGDINQEVGGVMITLAALCLANGFDMHAAGETELARIWTKVDQIRAKQAAKPKHSPLPGYAPPSSSDLVAALEEAKTEIVSLIKTIFTRGSYSDADLPAMNKRIAGHPVLTKIDSILSRYGSGGRE